MVETSVEKIVRNKFGSIVGAIFAVLMLYIIGKDFYHIFHNTAPKFMEKVLPGIQLIAAIVSVLWLAVIMIISSMTLSGPAFKKTCPYTFSCLLVLALEFFPLLGSSSGYMQILWIILAVGAFAFVLLQMLAFSLDSHSTSIFSVFRPFRIEVLTVIHMSNNAVAPAQNGNKSVKGSVV